VRSHQTTVDRKTSQLCGQVRDALSMIVPGLGDGVLNGLTVVSVEPAPHAGRLRVTVATDVADVTDRTTVGRHLARATGAIREEVANAITRRKVPELVFTLS
jgi:ribosome-binding factor A